MATTKKEAKTEKVKRAPRAAKPVITITSAFYGSEEKKIDVTKKLVYGRKITNRLVGEDPHPKVRKTLSVKAAIDGKAFEKVFNEGDKLVF